MTTLTRHDRTRCTTNLPADDTAAIVRVFGVDGAPATGDHERVQALLSAIRESFEWLACGCQPGAPEPPLMSPRLLHDGSVVLVRHGEVDHAAGCPLRQFPRAHAHQGDVPALFRYPPLDAAVASTPTLLTPMLRRLILTARLNTISTSAIEREEPDHHLVTNPPRHLQEQLEVAGELPIDAHVQLSDVWCHHPGAVHLLRDRILRAPWDSGTTRHGYYIGLDRVDRAGRVPFRTRSGTEALLEPAVFEPGWEHAFESRGENAYRPAWCLGLLTANAPSVERLAAIPALSFGLPLALGHDIDRAMLRAVLGVAMWIRTYHTVTLELTASIDSVPEGMSGLTLFAPESGWTDQVPTMTGAQREYRRYLAGWILGNCRRAPGAQRSAR